MGKGKGRSRFIDYGWDVPWTCFTAVLQRLGAVKTAGSHFDAHGYRVEKWSRLVGSVQHFSEVPDLSAGGKVQFFLIGEVCTDLAIDKINFYLEIDRLLGEQDRGGAGRPEDVT